MLESREAHFEKRITDALVKVGILGEEHLKRSRQVSQTEGSGLLETLVTTGMVARGIVITMMGLQLRVPVEDLHNSNVSFEAVTLCPKRWHGNTKCCHWRWRRTAPCASLSHKFMTVS